MNYHWVKAEASHIPAIAERCRVADIEELWAAEMLTPAQAMQKGLDAGGEAWTGFIGGTPVCMFGVSHWTILGRSGAPWMIGTTDIKPHAKAFLKGSRDAIKLMREPYDLLVNMVDDRHTEAIIWLRWLGFTIHEPMAYGAFGLPFRAFEWRRS